MGGKTVAQGVRRDVLFDAGGAGVFFYMYPNRLAAERPAARRKEDFAEVRSFRKGTASFAEIALHPFDGLFADGDDPFFLTLADRAEEARLEVDVAEFDVRDFTNAHTRSVHKLQHGLVTQPEFRVQIGRGQQSIDLFVIKHGRKCPPEFWRVDGL